MISRRDDCGTGDQIPAASAGEPGITIILPLHWQVASQMPCALVVLCQSADLMLLVVEAHQSLEVGLRCTSIAESTGYLLGASRCGSTSWLFKALVHSQLINAGHTFNLRCNGNQHILCNNCITLLHRVVGLEVADSPMYQPAIQ